MARRARDKEPTGYVSYMDTKPDTLAAIDAWIRDQHPAGCQDALKRLIRPEFECATTGERLLAHCIDEHDASVAELIEHAGGRAPVHDAKTGLQDAVRRNTQRLFDELLATKDLARNQAGQIVLSMITSQLDAEGFAKAWHVLWEDRGRGDPQLAGAILRTSAWSAAHNAYARSIIQKELERAYNHVPDDVVRVVLHARHLEDLREEACDRLLDARGLDAAKSIVRDANYTDPPRAIVRATCIILDADPNSDDAPRGVAASLDIDPTAFIPTLVFWMNGERDQRHIDHQELRWKLADHANALLPAFAEDAIKREGAWQQLLAETHHFRLRDNAAAADWLEKNVDRDEGTEYAASLLIEALSLMKEANDDAIGKRLQAAAEHLHGRKGTYSKETLIQRHNLTDPGLDDRDNLIAIALARDVLHPPEVPDPNILLANLQAHPATYAALGGATLEKLILAGKPPVHYEIYRDDVDAIEKGLLARHERGEITKEGLAYRARRPIWIRRRRAYWEERFAKIAAAGVKIAPGYSRKLREITHVWNEIRVLARLVDYFRVTPEPKGLPGMANKDPDFLLESPDGDLIFELATIGDKPGDLRTGVKTSAGGEAKRILNRKLTRQFGYSKTGITLPVVIGIEMQWGHDLEFDLLNSLYGPLAVSFSTHKETGEIVREGTTRHVEKAFFAQQNVGCISAVAGISPDEEPDGTLRGELMRPLRESDRPLPLPLWVRLRTALYGARPKKLVNEMAHIPTITKEEAIAMVDLGVDEPAFLAAERYDKPADLDMTDKRWEELVAAARHRQTLARTGAIVHLRAAKGVDLAPLTNRKIHLIKELREKPRPDDFPLDAWQAMLAEAELYLGPPAPTDGGDDE